MKKSILSLALLTLMTAGLAHADTATTTTVTPNDLFRFNLVCSFPSSSCSAESRILLDIRQEDARSVSPQWFGNLLSVSCPSAGGLFSASDAVLYRLLDGGSYRWQIDNSDATVHILLQDHPFDGNPHVGTGVIAAKLKVGDEGGVTGFCAVTPKDVHGLN